ncbi:triosephosphate isomerase [Leeuwenhoekiella aestuarii]|uniref:Triosephosphate isomerase n=1 Tax=Leeuwenhoekiella aestuarii TaxID=2249426 RepID=A0A4Q0NVY1_9FLAO|nr:triose-phosphate isomerase [Leeuwenhoekiella aestuarii]RXG12429.1 triosephosphate isomerase [Leeuwenhoekiella aestuarii]RXG16443.1 triosephosphate isomerase [Leeuwenhoekiella aestuarii]
MRKNIVAGNWKMNTDLADTQELIGGLKSIAKTSDAEIIIAPPFTNLYSAFEALKGSGIEVAAQNMHQSTSGAFTGEISASMLKGVGVKTVILGHSERRAYFEEKEDLLAEKVNTALENDIKVIYCFGEELKDRNFSEHFEVVNKQISQALFHLDADAWKHIILAYEPVWAIGTGETASPDQAQEMHAFIRKTIADEYSQEVADSVTVLYGGSVKPANAKEIFSKPDVDGGLIGGASLKAEDFMAIVNAF